MLVQDTDTDHMVGQLVQKFCQDGGFPTVEDCAQILADSGNDYDEAVRRLMAVKGQVRSPLTCGRGKVSCMCAFLGVTLQARERERERARAV